MDTFLKWILIPVVVVVIGLIIEYWVIRKNISFTDAKGKALTPRQMAWAIAMHMKTHDTKGAFMFKKGFAAAKPQVLNAWRGVPTRIVDRLSRSM